MYLKRTACTIILLHVLVLFIYGQDADEGLLFGDDQSLSITLTMSLSEIKKNHNDSTYFASTLYYKNSQGGLDSIPVDVRARGNFRRKHCFLPPLRIRIKKNDAKETLFAGTKSLKLVLPCHAVGSNTDLILKEYLCYQLYEPATPYVFNTRLLDITLRDVGNKHTKTYTLKGFFIEDDDAVAKRFRAKVIEPANFNPMLLQDTSSLRLDLFQYMIANTDFSTTFLHNIKIIQLNSGHYIPVAYDFDMSGIVNAPYATFDEALGIKSVRDRHYKGYCRNEKVAEFVRTEYINLEPKISEVLTEHESLFQPKELEGIRKYIAEFFTTIKRDESYREKITEMCRTR